jgi:hypothetical protein
MTEQRKHDSADFDLETFVDLFDTAMTSTNPAVQKAFKNLLMVSAIVHAKEEGLRGPLRKLIEDVKGLERRLTNLEGIRYVQDPFPNYPIPGTITTPNTGNPPSNWPPNTIIGVGTGGQYTLTSTTAYDDQYSSDMSDLQLYKKLESK